MSRERELSLASGYLDRAPPKAADASCLVTPQMRAIVTSWLVEVAAEFRLQQETLFLGIALLDRFQACFPEVNCTVRLRGRRKVPPRSWTALSSHMPGRGCPSAHAPWALPARPISTPQGVAHNVLQLVAVTAIMVACKLDEVSADQPPPSNHCGTLACNASKPALFVWRP